MAANSVLLVDDEISIVDSLLYAFSSEGFRVQSAATAQEALIYIEKSCPDFIVLDLGLPDRSGFEVCKDLRKAGNNTPILFLTARAEEVDRILGLELGGDDYVVKPFSPREVVARAKAILRRFSEEESKPPKQQSEFSIDEDKLIISFKGEALNLSRYEFRLLTVLVKRPGRVFSREELMNRAWETPDMTLERTVDTHIKTIRTKIRSISSEADPIVTHRGFGYSIKETKIK